MLSATRKKLVEVESDYEDLKNTYTALNEANKELKSNVNRLSKLTANLEEANLKLLDQKEALEHKKIQLEDISRKKDDLVAIAVHDIKNPAAAIQSLVELLNSYDLTACEQNEIMESLVCTSTSILELAQGISESFAKQEFDEGLKFQQSSLKEVIDSITKLNIANAGKKNIRVINQSTDAIPDFEFDTGKIEEVIDNIKSYNLEWP